MFKQPPLYHDHCNSFLSYYFGLIDPPALYVLQTIKTTQSKLLRPHTDTDVLHVQQHHIHDTYIQ